MSEYTGEHTVDLVLREVDDLLTKAIVEMNNKQTVLPIAVRANIGRAANLIVTYRALKSSIIAESTIKE